MTRSGRSEVETALDAMRSELVAVEMFTPELERLYLAAIRHVRELPEGHPRPHGGWLTRGARKAVIVIEQEARA